MIDQKSDKELAEIHENLQRLQDVINGFVAQWETMDPDPFRLAPAYTEWWAALMSNPQKFIDESMNFWKNSIELSHQAMMDFMTGEPSEPLVEAGRDKRFKHHDWNDQPYFSAIKQSYLLTSQWLRNLVSDVDGLDPHTAEKVQFFTERYIDAMSPSNFALTNPEVIEKTIESHGENLVHGMENMLADLEDGEGKLNIRITDTSAFTLGENVAVTPGKVVFQNRLFQLIQYAPATDKVLKRPLLIVPPWINKFYILDLQPENSFLKWATDQGHTVFVVSWVNPDENYADTEFADYLRDGVMTAVDAVQAATGEEQMNAIGYCIGGTLLASTLAYMKAKGDKRIASVTFFTTMLDFSEPGELGVFIDEEQVQAIEEKMATQGFLKGDSMAGAFNLMRANDLIWSCYVSNYLLGRDPRPFDLLYWNSDSTRMPNAMHSWYLRRLYMENALVKKEVEIDGILLDLSTVDIPVCFVSTVDDHIAPWKSTYMGAGCFGGPVEFILGSSGHIAGIVNPPAANKYSYRVIGGDTLPADSEAFLEQAEERPGSWWNHWNDWVYKASGSELVEARVPGDGALKPIEDAPGTYVRIRMKDSVPTLPFTRLPDPLPTAEPAPPEAPAEALLVPPPAVPAVPEAPQAQPAAAAASKAGATKQAGKKPQPQKPQPKKAPAKKAVSKEAVVDDLTKINGIGPAVRKLLAGEGITSFAQLAAMTPEQIRELLVSKDPRNKRFNPSSWPAQAGELKDD
ncbi:class I poly(R)-hydroxyalkanoic acid synthase [Granulosicoccaceae sp. 1_MG-2023]|nr:class I poly(R)-hydroxyalkanoic acid synthase [Granulosicoccaceae sp. 1_MG-2023]